MRCRLPRTLVFMSKMNHSSQKSEEVPLMKKSVWLIGSASWLLAACENYEGGNGDPSSQFIRELPEGVLAIAATNQDLQAVRISPADGCYVYRHVGPVETTFLPLKSVDGRPICTRPADAAPAG